MVVSFVFGLALSQGRIYACLHQLKLFQCIFMLVHVVHVPNTSHVYIALAILLSCFVMLYVYYLLISAYLYHDLSNS